MTDGELVAFFDNGSTVSLISKQFVQRRKWKGIPVTYDLITVGGDRKTQSTYLHEIQLLDSNGKEHVIKAFQIDDICGQLQEFNTSVVARCFKGLTGEDVHRPTGSVDLLISMRHADIHPKQMDEADGLVLHGSVFGTRRIIGGCHRTLKSDSCSRCIRCIRCRRRNKGSCMLSKKT